MPRSVATDFPAAANARVDTLPPGRHIEQAFTLPDFSATDHGQRTTDESMSNTLPLETAEYRREIPRAMSLQLEIEDRETIEALVEYSNEEERALFALKAIKIGVLALGQARGQIDTAAVRNECEKMLVDLDGRLREHTGVVSQNLAGSLREYFDPQNGKFHDRIERLIKRDGDLDEVLRRQVGHDDSFLAKTLAAHFGPESPLMKRLSPNEAEGLLAALRETFGKQLDMQREAVLKEFSLNNSDGALTRLVNQLTENQGKLTHTLQQKIETVVKEFSLNDDNSALSTLVKRVTDAQKLISGEFSLDNENSALNKLTKALKSTDTAIHDNLTLDNDQSALSRLRKEIVTVLEGQVEKNRAFQEEVKVALATITAKRGEAHSTHHGLGFEAALEEFVQRECQKCGDLLEATGNKFGLLQRKIGDFVLELGPDNVAAKARIVIEAKEDKGYDLKKSQLEIEEGRKNRDAKVGLFVYSRLTAPEGIESLSRVGNDVFVVWDYEDPQTDVFLKTALTLAKALCIRIAQVQQKQAVDFAEIDQAILEIGKRSKSLDEINTWSQTIVKSGEKIQEHVRKAQKALDQQCQSLAERVSELKQMFCEVPAAESV
jgi:hypothetical protein